MSPVVFFFSSFIDTLSLPPLTSTRRPFIWLFGQAVLYFEGVGPFFLFSPWRYTASRIFAAVGIMALHMGFGFSMRYGRPLALALASSHQ